MANMQNRKGRSKGSGKFVMLPEYFLRSDAYRSLSPYSRALLVELIRKFDGTNNGHIGMSLRDAAKLVGCSDQPIRKALKELQEKGFLRIAKRGAYSIKKRHATEWTLTLHPVNNTPATKDFMRWVAPSTKPKQQKPKKSKHGGMRDALQRYEIPQSGDETLQICSDGGTRNRSEDKNASTDGGTRNRIYISVPHREHTTETLKHISRLMPDRSCNQKGQARSH